MWNFTLKKNPSNGVSLDRASYKKRDVLYETFMTAFEMYEVQKVRFFAYSDGFLNVYFASGMKYQNLKKFYPIKFTPNRH